MTEEHSISAPPALVALLGSSNLTIALPHAVNHLLSRLGGRTITVFVAHGPGRSYGVDSGSFGIKFRALSQCDLLPAFEQAKRGSPSADARVLLTDIGNDIMHGAGAKHLTSLIRGIIQRLRSLGAAVGVTSLPVDGLASIPPWKYRLARNLIYPTSRAPQQLVLSHVHAIQGDLQEMESHGKLQLLGTRREWYAADGCHLRLSKSREAMAEWLDLLLGIDPSAPNPETGFQAPAKESLYFHCPPEYQLFGSPRKRQHRPFAVARRVTMRSF